MYHHMPKMMIHTYTKFAALDFINKKMIEKRGVFYPNRISPLSSICSYALNIIGQKDQNTGQDNTPLI